MADRKRKRTQETLDKLERVKQGMGIPDKMADEFDEIFLEELENAPDGNITLEAEFTAFAMATAIIRHRISGAFKVLEEAAEATLAGMDDKEIAELIPYIAIELDSRGYDFTSCRWPGKKPPLKELIQAAKRRQSADKGELYAFILQGTGTNAVTHSSKRQIKEDDIRLGGEGVIEKDEVTIILGDARKNRLDVTTHQTLDALVMKMTKYLPRGENATEKGINDNRTVVISVEEFMQMRGLSDLKTARQQLKDSLQTLFNLSLKFIEVRGKGKNKQEFDVDSRILSSKAQLIEHGEGENDGDNENPIKGKDASAQNPIKNGIARVRFEYDVAEYLAKSFLMPYPQGLLGINGKQNPHSYYLGRKMVEHHNMNIADPNSNRISVRSLLQACPDIPSYETIMQGKKQVTDRIIEPFDRDMDALEEKYGVLESWEYCNSKGAPLTEEQLTKLDYGTWERLLVNFELANYPDQTKRIEKKTRERKAAKEAKEKRQRKAKAKEPVKG